MHDYLATDGETSYRSRGEEADARRQLYSGRDKTKVDGLYGFLFDSN
jgi:Xaa-Pro aminopeptidase